MEGTGQRPDPSPPTLLLCPLPGVPPRCATPTPPGSTCAARPAGQAGPRVGRPGGDGRSGMASWAAPGAEGPQPPEDRASRGAGVRRGRGRRWQQQRPEQQEQSWEAARHGVRRRVVTRGVSHRPGPGAGAADLKVPRPGSAPPRPAAASAGNTPRATGSRPRAFQRRKRNVWAERASGAMPRPHPPLPCAAAG